MISENIQYCVRCGTEMETKIIFGAEHPVCPSCEWIYFEDPKVAVGVLVEQNGKILLVKRQNEPKSGYWSFPAGFMDAFELPEEAARRECFEETGLIVEIGEIAAVIGGREHPKGADIVIAYHAEVIAGELKAGDDASEAAYFSLDALPPLAFKATRIALRLD